MKVITTVLAALLGCAAVFANGNAAQNVVVNGSFEEGQKGWGTLVNAGKFNFSIDSEIARRGRYAAKMECTAINPKADGTWRQPKAWARWIQKVTVKPGTKYQFRCFGRGKKDSTGNITIYLSGNAKPEVIGFSAPLKGEEWVELKNDTFIAKGTTAVIYVNYYGTGTVWIDDVEMIEIK